MRFHQGIAEHIPLVLWGRSGDEVTLDKKFLPWGEMYFGTILGTLALSL
jgi:hypothetical protein